MHHIALRPLPRWITRLAEVATHIYFENRP
jgi:hypothetical protein